MQTTINIIFLSVFFGQFYVFGQAQRQEKILIDTLSSSEIISKSSDTNGLLGGKESEKLGIYQWGCPRFLDDPVCESQLLAKYGVYYMNMGCCPNKKQQKSYRRHNEKVYKILSSRLGVDWKEFYMTQIVQKCTG